MGPVPRWVVAVAGVALVVVAVDVGVFLSARNAPAKVAAPLNGAVAVIDPQTQRVVSRVEVGRDPTSIAAGYGGVWVLNKAQGTVAHLDGRTAKLVATLAPKASVTTLSVGAGGVWLAGPPRRTSAPLQESLFERVNPATGAVDRTFDTATGATVLAAGGHALWSTGYLGGYVRGAARSDAATGKMRRVDIPIYGDLVTADDSAVYYVGTLGKRVARVSTTTGLVTD